MFRVLMTIDGQEVSSSCVRSGTLKQCRATAGILTRQKGRDPRVGWVVLPCIGYFKCGTCGHIAGKPDPVAGCMKCGFDDMAEVF